jgi:predicted methyltransferase
MEITAQYIKQGDIVVDATAGNGNDTLALSNLVGAQGKVYAFDIQENAIEKTRKLLAESSSFCYAENEVSNNATKQGVQEGALSTIEVGNTVLISDSHDNMSAHITEKGEVSAVVFNLGYLPSGDKSLHTMPESSILAIKEALKILKKGGIVSIVMYPGTEPGRIEKDAVFQFVKSLPPESYHVCRCDSPNQPSTPPEIVWIETK